MSVVTDSETEAQSKNEYDSEFTAASVVDTNGELQAAETECWFCSDCSITI